VKDICKVNPLLCEKVGKKKIKRKGWTVLTRCNVVRYDDCAECPPTIVGIGWGKEYNTAKKNAELETKGNLVVFMQGKSGCHTKHCHPIRCWKNGNQVPCPSWN